MLNAKQFYGQLGVHFNALQYCQKRLNYRYLLAQHEPYSQLPGKLLSAFFPCFYHFNVISSPNILFISTVEGELVLVLLDDGTFYRARVLTATAENEISVWIK